MHPDPTFVRASQVTVLVILAALASGCAHESPPPRASVAVVAPVASSEGAPKQDLVTEGRRWTQAFYDGHIEEMYAQMDTPLRNVIGDQEAFAAFRRNAVAQLGTEVDVISERTELVDGVSRYVRVARFERVPMHVHVSLAFGDDGRIVFFLVKPERRATTEATTDKLDYVTRTALHLPFEGAWTVAWGGRTLAQNQHAATRDQRFAYDFLIKKEGVTHAGDGTHNADYFAYGRNVLAPAAGRVVAAVDGVAENVPGQMDSKHLFGNYVVLDHGGSEFSMLAHLQTGSITVHDGDAVEMGRVLGKCGNSGHSSEPHLHYHLQNAATLLKADGLPAPLVDYVADGKPVVRGEATRFQVIEPAPVARRSGEGS